MCHHTHGGHDHPNNAKSRTRKIKYYQVEVSSVADPHNLQLNAQIFEDAQYLCQV